LFGPKITGPTISKSAQDNADLLNVVSAISIWFGVALAMNFLACLPLAVFRFADFSIVLIDHKFSLSSKMLGVDLNGRVPSNLTNFIDIILSYFEPDDEL
jgi:hypothetical protein